MWQCEKKKPLPKWLYILIQTHFLFGKSIKSKNISCFIFNQNNWTYMFTKLSHPRVPSCPRLSSKPASRTKKQIVPQMVTNMEYLQIAQLPRIYVHVYTCVMNVYIIEANIRNLSMTLGVNIYVFISSTKGLEKRNLRISTWVGCLYQTRWLNLLKKLVMAN